MSPSALWAAAVVGVLATAGGLAALAGRDTESTDDAQLEADVVAVSVRTAGTLQAVHVVENQRVEAGAPLLSIDPSDQLARVQGAEAELGTARAQAAMAHAQVQVVEAQARGGLRTARAQVAGSSQAVHAAEAQVSSARAAHARAEANLRRTQADVERAKTLFQARAVAQEYLDHTQAAFDAARAEVAQMEAMALAATEARSQALSHVEEAAGHLGQSQASDAQIAAAHAQVDLAEASVRAAEARLVLQRLQLSYAQLKAPVAGTLSRLGVRAGEVVQPNQVVAELVPAEAYVVANFKETQTSRMRAGQPARVRVDALGGRTLHAQVESLSAGTGARFSLLPPDNASGNFVKVVQRVPVRLSFRDLPPGITLRAGLSCDVRVQVDD